VGVGVLLTLAVLTSHAAAVWQSDQTLWKQAVSVTPDRPRPLVNLARATFVAATSTEDYETALRLTETAQARLAIRPRAREWQLITAVNRALLLLALHRPDDARIAVHDALAHDPNFFPARRIAAWLD